MPTHVDVNRTTGGKTLHERTTEKQMSHQLSLSDRRRTEPQTDTIGQFLKLENKGETS